MAPPGRKRPAARPMIDQPGAAAYRNRSVVPPDSGWISGLRVSLERGSSDPLFRRSHFATFGPVFRAILTAFRVRRSGVLPFDLFDPVEGEFAAIA